MKAFKPPFMPGRTGYRIAFRTGEPNHCPGCGQSHWIVGRMTAECAYCATALPINVGGLSGPGVARIGHGRTDLPIAA